MCPIEDYEVYAKSSTPKIRLWSTQEVAEASDTTREYIARLCREGRLDCVKVSGVWLIRDYSVDRWLRSSRKVGRPPKGSKPEGGKQLGLDLTK